jgi:hypothetical protein
MLAASEADIVEELFSDGTVRCPQLLRAEACCGAVVRVSRRSLRWQPRCGRAPVPAGGDRRLGPLAPSVQLCPMATWGLLVERGVKVDHVTVYWWVNGLSHRRGYGSAAPPPRPTVAGVQPFKAPAVRPLVIWSCRNAKSTSTGIAVIVMPAKSVTQLVP